MHILPGAPLARALPAILLATSAWLFGCSREDSHVQVEEVRSGLHRDTTPGLSDDERTQFARGQADFAVDLYRTVGASADHANRNLFLSPVSLSTVLAMTYGGARGSTAEGMRKALRYELPDDRIHAAFDDLDLALSSRGQNVSGKDPFRLRVVNSAWAQKGMVFEAPFLDNLAVNYGTGVKVVDFKTATDASRRTINGWVDEQTEQRIPEVFPEGQLSADTRLALVNAVYFKAAWAEEFDARQTKSEPFMTLDGRTPTVSMMHGVFKTFYLDAEDYEAAALWYQGFEVQMLFVVPKPGKFETVESSLTGGKMLDVLGGLGRAALTLALPKFRLDDSFDLEAPLTAMGMGAAFSDAADFRGMAAESLKIGKVVQKTFVSVDEHHTEAAAASATGMEPVAYSPPPPPVTLTVDRPFLAAIVDTRTRSLVFFGRILDPSN
ncbi:serpin family protein [Labilithrix luteola]|nr:serpin family protein [Labilithrix luteola]